MQANGETQRTGTGLGEQERPGLNMRLFRASLRDLNGAGESLQRGSSRTEREDQLLAFQVSWDSVNRVFGCKMNDLVPTEAS